MRVLNLLRLLYSIKIYILISDELFCLGIDAVKEALRSGIAVGTEEIPVKINLIAPPV